MPTAQGNISNKVAFDYKNALDGRVVTDPIVAASNYNFTNGTGAGQINAVWMDTRTLTASATEDLDLAGGLTDAFGNALTFTKVKFIKVTAAEGNTNNVVVGGAVANQFPLFSDVTDKAVIKAGGEFQVVDKSAAGYAVTAGTGDLLRIANSAGTTSVTYTIIIGGCV